MASEPVYRLIELAILFLPLHFYINSEGAQELKSALFLW